LQSFEPEAPMLNLEIFQGDSLHKCCSIPKRLVGFQFINCSLILEQNLMIYDPKVDYDFGCVNPDALPKDFIFGSTEYGIKKA